MGWELVEKNTNIKPVLNSSIPVHLTDVIITPFVDGKPDVVGNQYEAYKILNHHVEKGTAGFKAFLDPDSFKPSKKLINESKSVIKQHLKIQAFKLIKVKAAVTKNTKTCPTCKVNYPLDIPCTFLHKSERHIKELEQEIKRLESDILNPEKNISVYTDIHYYDNIRTLYCPCCSEKNILLTKPSAKKVEEMEALLITKAETFFKNRSIEENKQAMKENAIVIYKVISIIHELDVNHGL